ncbi:unnamed protein product [Rotaria sordida]|uniref:Uncharacterized protein n=1 Tax=Rotaria sordida TaxID=392033 RepID=A0A819N822_9BILA|nr:unnamed protein product [Rotaria sordida]
MFLKEREKLFSSKTNPEQTISPPTPNDTIPLIIDETHQDIHEDNNAPIDIIVDSSVITTTISIEKLHDEKSFPDPYVLPSLPNAISVVQDSPPDIELSEKKAKIIRKDFQNSSFDDPHFERLWFETYEYRKNFIKQNTVEDILKQFPAYSNPSMILADVKMLTGIDLSHSVQEKLDTLTDKICTITKFPTGIL